MTAERLVALALKAAGILGIGQTPLPEDVNDAFELLNMIIGQWNSQRWLAPHLIDVFVPSQNKVSYTVGPGGDFNIGRVDRIEVAYARQKLGSNTPIDYQLDVLGSYEDYAAIGNKSLRSFPSQVFYDSAYPVATLYVYPIPSTAFDIHLVVKQTLDQLPNLKSQIIFPPEYTYALLWNLTKEIRKAYQLPADPVVLADAQGAIHNIRMANAQIQRAKFPPGLATNGGRAVGGITGQHTAVFTFSESVLAGGDYEQQISYHEGVLPGQDLNTLNGGLIV